MISFNRYDLLILIEDVELQSQFLSSLRSKTRVIDTCQDASNAMSSFQMARQPFVIVELNPANSTTNLDFMTAIQQIQSDTIVFAIISPHTTGAAVAAMRANAFGLFFRPIDPKLIVEKFRRACEVYHLQSENRTLRKEFEANRSQHESENDCSNNDSTRTAEIRSLAQTMDECEKSAIQQALEAFASRRDNAAKALGISIRTLHYKLKRHKLA